jgi:hypothetical protein
MRLNVNEESPKKKEPNRFIPKFYQNFEEVLTPVLLKLVHKIKRKGMLPNTFYKTSITLIPKGTTKKKTIDQFS